MVVQQFQRLWAASLLICPLAGQSHLSDPLGYAVCAFSYHLSAVRSDVLGWRMSALESNQTNHNSGKAGLHVTAIASDSPIGLAHDRGFRRSVSDSTFGQNVGTCGRFSYTLSGSRHLGGVVMHA